MYICVNICLKKRFDDYSFVVSEIDRYIHRYRFIQQKGDTEKVPSIRPIAVPILSSLLTLKSSPLLPEPIFALSRHASLLSSPNPRQLFRGGNDSQLAGADEDAVAGCTACGDSDGVQHAIWRASTGWHRSCYLAMPAGE